MNATVIDTLKLADHLKRTGFEPRQAEGLARALGDELAERMVTKRDLDDAVQTLSTTIRTMDAKFEARFDGLEPRFDARFDGLEPRFDAVDAKLEAQHREFSSRIEGQESRFDAVDARFDAVDARFDAVDARFDGLEPRFDAVDAKLEAQHREFSGKFNVLFGTMALGFTLVIGLMGYSLFSPRTTDPDSRAVVTEPQTLRIQPPSPARD